MRVDLAERNLLVGGEPGAGKSVGLNLIVGHAALSTDCRLVLVDGKRVELGAWRDCAEQFVGPDIDQANKVLRGLQDEMDDRYERLLDAGRRKIDRAGGVPPILVVFDELAYFSATVGSRTQQNEFVALVRDLARPGRRPDRRRRDPAALGGRRAHFAAGPVRLPVGVPLLHRRLLRRDPRPRLGFTRLRRRRR
jgi:S-DNA-T family DNA segregation ATPase FtsK/SpoIIIE